MKSLTDTFTLSNGYKIPCIGYGTWQTPDGETAVMAVREAIKAGYRHIDAAAIYGNEPSVGQGIQEGMQAAGISRSELFVTSKVWNTERGYDKTMAAFDKTLADLKLDYLDLYLIHWPASKSQFANWKELNLDTWRAMMDLYKAGRVRAIGVSNFFPYHMENLMDTEIPPMVNQIECHPGHNQEEIMTFCKANNILVEAYSPLGSGRVLKDERLGAIAAKYGKSTAQLCIRWDLQYGVLPLPKSVTPERIAQNADVFDFEISQEDMDAIIALPPFGSSGEHPDTVDF